MLRYCLISTLVRKAVVVAVVVVEGEGRKKANETINFAGDENPTPLVAKGATCMMRRAPPRKFIVYGREQLE